MLKVSYFRFQNLDFRLNFSWNESQGYNFKIGLILK